MSRPYSDSQAPSRSPSGERGLKLQIEPVVRALVGRSPSGERGLKFRSGHRQLVRDQSLPIRGAWIEITTSTPARSTTGSRSPSGERGLKSVVPWVGVAWTVSLPIRGAWIEIYTRHVYSLISPCRSPSGERGLKFEGAGTVARHGAVAPHPGSVD